MSVPEVNFIDTSPETIQSAVISAYESITDKKLFPGDPVRLFLLSLASLIIQQRVLMNDAAKQNLLRYATGSVLDHLGERVETPRNAAQPALTTERITLSAPQGSAIAIPVGTRVTPGNGLFYQTKQSAQVNAGSLSVDVPVECIQSGTIGNGFIAGQINILVDPIPFVASVTNIDTSSGGTEEEDNDHYRERIRTAPENFSTAGPEGAYEFFAKSTNASIIDVYVYSPSDGVVEIIPLMAGGALPTQSILDAILIACSPKTVRPLTDKVQTAFPSQVGYTNILTYWIDKEDEDRAADIQAAVNAAIADYKIWQKSKLGRDINPSELNRRVINAGAKRTQITTPVFTALARTQVAVDQGAEAITYGGVE